MRTLVVLSGKGGAGKTSVAAGLLPFLPAPVLADADVEASNLPLLLDSELKRSEPFSGGQVARIDPGLCAGCLECMDACRFCAVESSVEGRQAPDVDPLACEGCGACRIACPTGAIQMEDVTTGAWFLSDTAFGPMVHARLGPGGENSGALVERVRREADSVARAGRRTLVLVDGPPGTGCPAISALTGADLALVVTEPTPSGQSDLLRILELIEHFGIAAAVLVNKADLHPRATERIAGHAAARGIQVVGCFPYDDAVPQALREGRILPSCSEAWRQRFARLWAALSFSLAGPGGGMDTEPSAETDPARDKKEASHDH